MNKPMNAIEMYFPEEGEKQKYCKKQDWICVKVQIWNISIGHYPQGNDFKGSPDRQCTGKTPDQIINCLVFEQEGGIICFQPFRVVLECCSLVPSNIQPKMKRAIPQSQ